MTQDSPHAPTPRRHGASRVIFIDLARALAVIFMLYGHTLDALMAPAYRSGLIFGIWQFQRGLTSCLFLLLSGFAFSIATSRHWASHLAPSMAMVKRLRRFGMFILLGYAIRIPVAPLSRMATAGEAAWDTLFGVDILQLIGVTFVGVQVLVLVSRSKQVFSALALVLAAVVTAMAPWAWSVDWWAFLPAGIASYLSPEKSSLFPLIPWSAFILLGAALGQVYARWGAAQVARYANLVLLLPGVVAILVSVPLTRYQVQFFGAGEYAFVPGNILLRTGACFILIGLIAHGSRRLTHLPHVFGAIAQESLVVYVLHLAIVYGSIWAPGLIRVYGPTLTPLQLLPIVVFMISTMALFANGWNWLKHAHGRVARWATLAMFGALAIRLV